jgi:hypothetical protein
VGQCEPCQPASPPHTHARRFKLDYVYCWHGLPAYWGGVMPGEQAMLPLQSRVLFPKATPGVEEVEPSMAWNPAVLAGESWAGPGLAACALCAGAVGRCCWGAEGGPVVSRALPSRALLP